MSYRNYENISKFFDYIKLLKEQIDATKVIITLDKQTILCFIMALWEVEHFQSLVQILKVMSDMTIKKARNKLLENERRQAEKNGNKALNATGLVYCNSNH